MNASLLVGVPLGALLRLYFLFSGEFTSRRTTKCHFLTCLAIPDPDLSVQDIHYEFSFGAITDLYTFPGIGGLLINPSAKITRRIRMYDLRHSFDTKILDNGADLKHVSILLGH